MQIICKKEMMMTIKRMKSGKVVGSDDTPLEVLRVRGCLRNGEVDLF